MSPEMTKALRKFERCLDQAWLTDQSIISSAKQRLNDWSKADKAKGQLVKLIEKLEVHGKITS